MAIATACQRSQAERMKVKKSATCATGNTQFTQAAAVVIADGSLGTRRGC